MGSAATPARHAPRSSWLWPALALAFALTPAFFWSGKLLSEEVPGLLRKSWGDRTFLQKTFDPRGWDFYQGRELSYAIDTLDAQWVRWSLVHDKLWLVPPSGMLASLGFVGIGLWLAPRALPRLGGAHRWLALLLLLSSFVFQSSMGVLYRATKPLVAPLLLALLLLSLAEHRGPRLSGRAAFAAVFSLGLTTSLLDRQGLFYVAVLALVLSAVWVRTRRGLGLASGAVAAVGVWLAYFYVLGPWAIERLNGYAPSMRFQRLRPGRLLHPEPWLQAFGVLGDWTSVLIGGLPAAILVAAALAFFALWAGRNRGSPWRVALAAGCLLAAAAAQITMVAMMIERHAPVTWIGNRLWYYPLPYQALLTFGLLWALDLFPPKRAGSRATVLAFGLAALVVLNVAGWPEKRLALESDPPFQEQSRHSAFFVRSFESAYPEPQLDGGYRRFYFECLTTFPRLAARARDQVGEGEGFLRAELRDGRLSAWARQEAHLVVWARAGGRFRLTGRARLRDGDSLSVLLGSRRLLAEVRAAGRAPARLSIPLELAAGANDVALVSSLDEQQVPNQSHGTLAAFELLLPLQLLPEAGRGSEQRPAVEIAAAAR